MLINGLKFDIRVYALVLCADPLDVFVFRQGLVRFATVPYRPPTSGNLGTQRMHLTNYAVNRRPGAPTPQAGPPSDTAAAAASPQASSTTAGDPCVIKWSFKALFEHLDANGTVLVVAPVVPGTMQQPTFVMQTAVSSFVYGCHRTCPRAAVWPGADGEYPPDSAVAAGS